MIVCVFEHVQRRSALDDTVPSAMEVLECAKPLNFSRSRLVTTNCVQNAEVWDRKNLAIAQLTLEVDSNYSRFIGCDAMGPGHTMDCHCGGGHHGFPRNESYRRNADCNPGVGLLNLTSANGTGYGIWAHGRGRPGPEPNLTDIDYWRYNIADLLGGHWYSTVESGLCGGKTATACTWRVAEVVKKVSRTCHNQGVFAAVQVHGRACFDTCPQPRNSSSECWIRCYYNTMLGPNSGTGFGEPNSSYLAGHMPIATLEDAWLAAFRSDDPEQGGCPNLIPPPPAPPATSTAIGDDIEQAGL